MQVSLESEEGLTRRLRVGLESEQIEGEMERRLREVGRTARLKGFRPGKIPAKVLRRQFGAQVLQEVFGQLVQESFAKALAEIDLQPAGPPRIDPDIDEAAQRYGYVAEFEVMPRFALGNLDGKTIKRPVVEVTDADLDRMLTRLREGRKTFVPVDRPAQSGDRLRISFRGTRNGEPLPGGSAEDRYILLGLGGMIPGFEEGLVGASAEEERRLDLRFPDDYANAELRGQLVTFEVRIGEVCEPVVPPLDADLARDYGIADGDLDRFRTDIRYNMQRELAQRVHAKVKAQAMDLLLETNPIEVPEVFVRDELEAMARNLRDSTGLSNLTTADVSLRDQARRRVALGLIMSEVVRANRIELDRERVRESVVDLASTYEDPQAALAEYLKPENLAPVESLTLERQVVDWIMTQVTVIDEPMSFEDLSLPAAGGFERLQAQPDSR